MNLFGKNIQNIVYKNIIKAGGLQKGILTKVIQGARGLDVTNGLNITLETYEFQGFLESKTNEFPDDVTNSIVYTNELTILGGSIAVKPSVGDTAVINGINVTLTQIKNIDPAEAVYTFIVN